MREKERFVNFKIADNEISWQNLTDLLGGRHNALTLYLRMKSKIVRDGWRDSYGFPIKKNYYDNGLLAMTMSRRRMAKEWRIHKTQIDRWIVALHGAGWIRVEKLPNNQYVYIFGTWRKDKNGVVHEEFWSFWNSVMNIGF